jgi:hypothetical protein
MRFSRNIDPLADFAFRRDGTPARDAAELAHWIGAPTHRIDDQPLDFEHVRFG